MLAAMKEIINPDVIVDYDQHNNTLIIKETDEGSALKKLYITHLPTNFLAFTLDYQFAGNMKSCSKQLSCYVNASNGSGVNKGCDLIVLWRQDNQNYALIFDLKSDKPRQSDTKKQLENSRLYLNYLLSMASAFYSIDTEEIIVKKAIVVTDERSVRKRSIYAPNQSTISLDDYRIESVAIKPHQEAFIAFGRLVA